MLLSKPNVHTARPWFPRCHHPPQIRHSYANAQFQYQLAAVQTLWRQSALFTYLRLSPRDRKRHFWASASWISVRLRRLRSARSAEDEVAPTIKLMSDSAGLEKKKEKLTCRRVTEIYTRCVDCGIFLQASCVLWITRSCSTIWSPKLKCMKTQLRASNRSPSPPPSRGEIPLATLALSGTGQ